MKDLFTPRPTDVARLPDGATEKITWRVEEKGYSAILERVRMLADGTRTGYSFRVWPTTRWTAPGKKRRRIARYERKRKREARLIRTLNRVAD